MYQRRTRKTYDVVILATDRIGLALVVEHIHQGDWVASQANKGSNRINYNSEKSQDGRNRWNVRLVIIINFHWIRNQKNTYLLDLVATLKGPSITVTSRDRGGAWWYRDRRSRKKLGSRTYDKKKEDGEDRSGCTSKHIQLRVGTGRFQVGWLLGEAVQTGYPYPFRLLLYWEIGEPTIHGDYEKLGAPEKVLYWREVPGNRNLNYADSGRRLYLHLSGIEH